MHRPVTFGALMAAGVGMVILAVSPTTNANYSDTVKVPITVTIQVPSTDGPADPPTPSETPNGLNKGGHQPSPSEDATPEKTTTTPPVTETPESTASDSPDTAVTPDTKEGSDEPATPAP